MSELIVVGCPVKERAWCLQRWFDSIAEQNVDVQIVCYYTESEDETEGILLKNNAHVFYDYNDGRSLAEINGHMWGRIEDYQYMADLRNTLVDTVIAEYNPDYFFSLDSDIMLPPGALERLLNLQTAGGVIAPAVNMGIHSRSMNVMSWTDRYNPSTAHRPFTPPAGYVDVVMAAMLLDRQGMNARWVAHPQGEDVGFCLDAKSKGIPLWWEASIECDHLMIPY